MQKLKALIFGATDVALRNMDVLTDRYDIVCLMDVFDKKYTSDFEGTGYACCSLDEGLIKPYDVIVIAASATYGLFMEMLLARGVGRGRIITELVSTIVEGRISFLENFARDVVQQQIPGSVAEGGVFQGEFAREINKCFPERKLYLFDTFTGFDQRDVEKEPTPAKYNFNIVAGRYDFTTEELVLNKMPHPEKVEIRKGYFPQTAVGLEDKFCFVNLDFDLYEPIYQGLEFFVPKMSPGGVILVHDYYSDLYSVPNAVKAYEDKYGKLNYMPIGDKYSIAILL